MSILDSAIFKAVREHADHMLEYGRGPLEEAEPPLFASVVDPLDRAPKTHQVMPPPGIRINDFSWAGNNLMHDVPFLETLLALTEVTGDARYETAVDRALAFYVENCPHPETGLFPWGEHAQWSFTSRRILPNACQDPYDFVSHEMVIHEHLRFAPAWFWERVWQASPQAVVRFAKGLNGHLMDLDTFEHNRHAPMNGQHWNEIPYQGQGKDFARHAGMYIFDCLFAYSKSGDESLLEWARRKTRYHMDRRHPNGILKGCIRTKTEREEGQHDSFACSLYDAAKVLGEDTAEGREFMTAARELFAARENQDLGAEPSASEEPRAEDAWNSGYGGRGPAWGGGSVAAMVYERTGMQRYADSIVRAAEYQAQAGPPWCDRPVVTSTLLENMRLPMDAFWVTGEQKFLDRAVEVAGWSIERAAPTGLFLGVLNMDYFANINICYSVLGTYGLASDRPAYYFSGTGAPGLVRNLLRLALLQEGEPDILGVDPHGR